MSSLDFLYISLGITVLIIGIGLGVMFYQFKKITDSVVKITDEVQAWVSVVGSLRSGSVNKISKILRWLAIRIDNGGEKNG